MQKEESLQKMVQVIDSIIEEHPDEKGVIHAISYATAEHIMKHSRNTERIVTHENGATRMATLKEHVNDDRPTVLLSPSFTRGLDLPDDLARWQIICRLPWLSLGDKQTLKKRWSGKPGRRAAVTMAGLPALCAPRCLRSGIPNA